MQYLLDLLFNSALLSAFGGWLVAQGAKMIIEIVKGGFSLKRLTGGGGMPSAHSATVTGLVVGTAVAEGLGSTAFAIALFFAIIVVYDAMGVRYETGQEAKILNALRRRDKKEHKEELYDHDLEETMGHTLPEIIAGIIVGLCVGLIVSCVIL